MSLHGIDDVSAVWKFPDIDPPFDIDGQLNLLKSYGLNCLDVLMYRTGYENPNYVNFVASIRNKLHERGMQLWLQPSPDSGQEAADIINNVGGQGDAWKNTLEYLLTIINPDSLNILDEPLGDQSDQYATPTFMAKYISFLNSAIMRVRAIKPNLIVVIMGLPFWDIRPLFNDANMLSTIPPSSLLYVAMHIYYHWGASAPANPPSYPPVWEQWSRDYWDGNFESARTGFQDDLLNFHGVQTAINRGYNIFYESYGGNLYNPNFLTFCNDAANFAKEHNFGFIMGGRNDLVNYPYSCWLNQSGTDFNDYGKALLHNLIPESLPLPFHDDFNTDLSKWTQQSGTWSVQ